MCNDDKLEVGLASILEDFDDLEINIETPEGIPNVEPRADVRISDVAPIVRSAGARMAGELVSRRWSWPGDNGRPVYNFSSDGRAFTSGRCLILADGFYEHTDPEPGEAFTMLTTDPGEDVEPYHKRQIIPLTRDRWADWLDADVPAADVLRVLPKGSLPVQRVYPPAAAQAALL